MKFATYSLASLALGSSDAFFVRPPNQRPGFNWHSTHELSRGTADMPRAYDPNYSPPNPLTADTIIDTSGKCTMNPFIFLAVIDSNYGDDAKYSLFGSRNDDFTLAAGSGASNDAMWLSLMNCARTNVGIRKVMAIDALAAKRADVIESILETSVDDNEGGITHQKIKDVLFDDPLEFYKNFWKYNEFVRVFENSRFSKWSKINALLKIVGDSESPATRYRDRKYLMENLKETPFQYSTDGPMTTKYLPAYSAGNRAPWSRHNFLASQWNSPWYKPSGFVPLAAHQQGSETRRAIPMQTTSDNFVPLVEQEEYQISEEQAAAIELALESQE